MRDLKALSALKFSLSKPLINKGNLVNGVKHLCSPCANVAQKGQTLASFSKMLNGKIRAQIRLKIGKDEGYFNTQEEAEEWAASRESEMLLTHAKSITSTSKIVLFKDVVKEYFESADFSLKSKATQVRERTASRAAVSELGDLAISVLNYKSIAQFLAKRIKQKAKDRYGRDKDTVLSGNAIRLERNLLRNVFSFAQDFGYIQVNYMQNKYRIPDCKRNEKRLTESQFQAMIDVVEGFEDDARAGRASENLPKYFRFLMFSGCRPGEAAKIELSWVNLEDGKIQIPRRGSKKRNARDIPITKFIRPALEEQVKRAKELGSPFLFWSFKNKKREVRADGSVVRRDKKQENREFRSFDYSNSWKTFKRAAGLEDADIHPHLLRHEFISRLYEETDMSDGQIASLVGDVNIVSLEPYRHVKVSKLSDKLDEHLEATTFKHKFGLKIAG